VKIEGKPLPNGVMVRPAWLNETGQADLLTEIRAKVAKAPLFVPKMPRTGKEMSVRMTNFGPLGWVTDKERGYRYQAQHPVTGESWPDMPDILLKLWADLAPNAPPPQACLVNFYAHDAKMGMHQDSDEEIFDAPVISLSLGATCLFRVGGVKRGGKTTSLRLESGDALALSGPARMAYHGVDRLYAGTSDLIKDDGRLNLTLRRVTA
jgi:alkylated DNA repair protein (DNA oxidative demethylase)